VLGVVLGVGIEGAWLALPIYIITYSVLIYVKYRKGAWLRLRV
jgi:Na+-driven multidrug efflux pump